MSALGAITMGLHAQDTAVAHNDSHNGGCFKNKTQKKYLNNLGRTPVQKLKLGGEKINPPTENVNVTDRTDL